MSVNARDPPWDRGTLWSREIHPAPTSWEAGGSSDDAVTEVAGSGCEGELRYLDWRKGGASKSQSEGGWPRGEGRRR